MKDKDMILKEVYINMVDESLVSFLRDLINNEQGTVRATFDFLQRSKGPKYISELDSLNIEQRTELKIVFLDYLIGKNLYINKGSVCQ